MTDQTPNKDLEEIKKQLNFIILLLSIGIGAIIGFGAILIFVLLRL